METLLLTIAAVVVVYVLVMTLLPKQLKGDGQNYTQKALSRMMKENVPAAGEASLLKEQMNLTGPLGRFFVNLPGGKSTYELLLKAGFGNDLPKFFIGTALLFVILLVLAIKSGFGSAGVLGAVVLALYVPRKYLQRRIRKRNEQFINMFPDALDMIVRSVRSGFPLNTALRMIADNMDAPVSTEFRQVVDEVAYGRTLNEALIRMAQRIDQPDIQFFVVVLSVQQEAGGNLAEVLNNLSSVIRKRKQLRLKIKALTSEGRATAWVLGSLPVFVFLVLLFLSPTHLQPLFDTTLGNVLLGSAIGLLTLGGWIISNLADIDI